jgi:hypothetical protein
MTMITNNSVIFGDPSSCTCCAYFNLLKSHEIKGTLIAIHSATLRHSLSQSTAHSDAA